MLIWPWIWFVHSGEFESSKSVMYESAPELKALMTILRVDRAGDLDAAALQRRRHRRDLPVAVADRRGLGEEVGALAGVEPLGALGAGREQLLAARLEGAVQLGDELERRRASGWSRSRAGSAR